MSLFGSNNNDADSGKIVNSVNSINTPTVNSNSSNQPSTVIAKGVKLEGEFKSQGDVLVEGEISGTIETENSLNVGDEAFVKAGVVAGNAVIAGKVEGNLKIKKHLDLKKTAIINGDIECETVTIESGAKLNGNISCGGKKNLIDNNTKKDNLNK